MRYLWLLSLLFCFLISCRQDQKTDDIAGNSGMEFRGEELPKRSRINTKATEILNGWAEYAAFESSFDAIYTTANNEDMILVIDDLLEKQSAWEKSEYPVSFDKAQIKSRQNVLKTYLLKVKTDLLNRADFISSTKEMIEAYNALRGQFNVVMNSTLDPKLLSDEN